MTKEKDSLNDRKEFLIQQFAAIIVGYLNEGIGLTNKDQLAKILGLDLTNPTEKVLLIEALTSLQENPPHTSWKICTAKVPIKPSDEYALSGDPYYYYLKIEEAGLRTDDYIIVNYSGITITQNAISLSEKCCAHTLQNPDTSFKFIPKKLNS